MKQYIDKDKLLLELTRRLESYKEEISKFTSKYLIADIIAKEEECKELISFLDTLEVKEVRSSWSEEDETNLRRVEYACMKFFGGDSLLIGWLRKKIIATKEVDLEEGSMLK